MRYPTETKHGPTGYKSKSSGLSKEPQASTGGFLDFLSPEVPTLSPEAARAFHDWLKSMNVLEKPQPLFKKPSPLYLGFGLGVGLGFLLFGGGEADESAGPDGYVVPPGGTWTFALCAGDGWGCGYAGSVSYGDILHNDAACVPFAGSCDTKVLGVPAGYGHGTPWEAYQHNPGTVILVRELAARPGLAWRAGAWNFTGSPNPNPAIEANWTRVLTPGHGMPLRWADSEFPEDYPIMEPIVVPRPKTWDEAVAEPGTQPSIKPSTKPVHRPVSPIAPFPPGFPSIVLAPPNDGSFPPVAPPTTVITAPPGAGSPPGVTQPPGSDTVPQPPPRGTKEKKVRISQPGMAVINAATEALDFIGDVYKGLPKKRQRCHPGDVKCKLAAIYNGADEIDWAQVLANFVNSQLEDVFYGAIGKQVGKASRDLNITTGLNRALREAQKQAQGDGKGIYDQFFPQLTYDKNTRSYGVSWEAMGFSA